MEGCEKVMSLRLGKGMRGRLRMYEKNKVENLRWRKKGRRGVEEDQRCRRKIKLKTLNGVGRVFLFFWYISGNEI